MNHFPPVILHRNFHSLLLCIVVSALITLLSPQDAAAVFSAPTVTASYANATISEDVTWNGTVLVRGSLVVAPQATLRIEPGTVVRFASSQQGRQAPRLVIQGRIQCIGTADRPILFAPNLVNSGKGDWGGVLLLSSEKRNVLEHCRIEGAQIGLEARFSTVSTRFLSVTRSVTGSVLRDAIATLVSSTISACDTGLEAHDSEVEMKEGTFSANRRGMALYRSSVVMTSLLLNKNSQQALYAEDTRLKCTSCELSDNVFGAQITGGEGQIFLTRFNRNRETALYLSKARMKVSRCQITSNIRVGLHLDDNRATLWGNAISDNGGFNLLHTGSEPLVIVQNWWGARDEGQVAAKISGQLAAVTYFPWLSEKPAIFP